MTNPTERIIDSLQATGVSRVQAEGILAEYDAGRDAAVLRAAHNALAARLAAGRSRMIGKDAVLRFLSDRADAIGEKDTREGESTPELTIYRASHDSIVAGLYTTADAARAHCEAKVRQEEPAGSIRHLSWWADDIGELAEYELHITPAGTVDLIRGTGYVVTPLEVASEYDAEAGE